MTGGNLIPGRGALQLSYVIKYTDPVLGLDQN